MQYERMDKDITQQKPRLLDQAKQGLRYKHCSLSAGKVHVYWILFFIRWSGLRDPADMGAQEVETFLTMLATERHVSPAAKPSPSAGPPAACAKPRSSPSPATSKALSV